MGLIIIKVEKEDINTTKVGINYSIKCTNGIDIVFSPESLDELINDYNLLKEIKI